MKIAGIGDNVIDRYMNMGIMFPGGNAVNAFPPGNIIPIFI